MVFFVLLISSNLSKRVLVGMFEVKGIFSKAPKQTNRGHYQRASKLNSSRGSPLQIGKESNNFATSCSPVKKIRMK